MPKKPSLTPREQFWVGHLERCAARGQRLSDYGSEQGLSIGALYEAKARLRRRGVWPMSGPLFVRVEPAAGTGAAALSTVYRVSLPNGVVVETAGGTFDEVLSAAARLP